MNIYALIISFQPNEIILNNVISSLENQVQGICIIDNGGLNDNTISNTKCELIIKHLGENLGIAKATNIGFEILLNKPIDYVLLSDQDTIYPTDYVKIFVSNITRQSYNRVAAFCPVFFDTVSSEFKPVYINKNGLIRKCFIENVPMPVFQAIASGLFIDFKIYNKIGGMNEALFIDYVDFEWCWKVNKLDYTILCIPQMTISHSLGDSVVSMGRKKISEHSYVRYYYITRNTVYLALHSKYLSMKMKIQLFLKACLYPIGYSILCKPHAKNAYFTLKGFIHGIISKMGKLC